MGYGKIGVSDFALTVSAAIRAQMGIRRISNREIAKLIDRGATYVNSRIKDENEWALGDIEKLCELWNMTPCELIIVSEQLIDSDGRTCPSGLQEKSKHRSPAGIRLQVQQR